MNQSLAPFARSLMLLSALLAGAGRAAASEGQNLVKNDSFAELTDAGTPVGWTIQPARSDAARVAIDTTNSTTGGQSIRIDHSRSFYTRIEQLHVKVKPRTEYLVRFDCKVQNIREFDGSRGASLFIGNNGVLMSQLARIQAKSRPETPGWHTYSQVIQTGNNEELGLCLMLHNASGTAWFDNVQLLELTPTLTESLANERARKLIRPDIEAVRTLAEQAGDTEVLAELDAIAKDLPNQAFAAVEDYREGLPFYELQGRLYGLYGKMLRHKHPENELIISTMSPFSRSTHLQAVPDPLQGPIEVAGLRDDVEQFVLNFTNCTTEAQTIHSAVPAAVDMTVRRAVEVQSSVGLIEDALRKVYPDNDGTYRFDVPAGMTKQVWFEVQLDGQPGQKEFILEFRSGSKVYTQPVEVTTIDMAYPDSMPLTTFSYVWAYARNVISGRIPEVAEDLKTHHANAWMNRRGQPLPGPVVENGRLAPEKMRWELIDKSLSDFPFRHTFVFFIHPESYLKHGPEVFKEWVREVVPRFRERGLGYDRLLITLHDEPFSSDVQRIAEISALIREADPKLRIYSNFHDALSKADIRLLARSVDVIAPEYHQLTQANINTIKQAGGELWCYRVQERSVPPQDVRHAFWKLHEAGVKGYSVWAYVEDKDGWNMPEGASCYNMIYNGDPQELTPSKRWEAWREGIEDYALLDQLKAKAPGVYREVISKYSVDDLESVRDEVVRALASAP